MSERTRTRRFTLPVWVVLVAAVAALLWWAAREPLPVDGQTVGRGPVRLFVEEEGETLVLDRYVVATEVPGRLLRIALEEGDAVAAGDVVARLDPLAIQSRVEQAEARRRTLEHELGGVDRRRPKPQELEQAALLEDRAKAAAEIAERELDEARAAQEQARRDRDRARDERAEGSISQTELEAAELADVTAGERLHAREEALRMRRFEVRTAVLEAEIVRRRAHDVDWEEAAYRDRVAAVDAELSALRDDLARTELRAPADGVVLLRHHESERYLPAGTPVLEIGDPARLEVEAEFLSEDAGAMSVGMPAEVFGRALGDRTVPAIVRRIEPAAFEKISTLGVEQQRVRVRIAFDAPAGIGDRFRVDVRVILDERADALLVAEGALFSHRGRPHVFREVGGIARLTPVEVGISDGRMREVTGGLTAGDVVVLHPPGDVEDGVRIGLRADD